MLKHFTWDVWNTYRCIFKLSKEKFPNTISLKIKHKICIHFKFFNTISYFFSLSVFLSKANYLHQLFTPNFIVVKLSHAMMLSTNNTFGASNFADGAETRRHGKKKGKKLNGKTFSILVIAMLFASIELNQSKKYC